MVTHGCWIMCLLDYLFENPNTFELENCDEKRRLMSPLNTSTTKMTIHKKEANSNEDQRRKIQFTQIHDTAHLVTANIIASE